MKRQPMPAFYSCHGYPSCYRFRCISIYQLFQISVSDTDATGKIALHYAAEAGNVELFREVYDSDISLLDHKDNDGMTPFHFAVIGGNDSVVELLIDKGADVNNIDADKHSLIHWATVCGNIGILERLLKGGALVSTPDLYGAHALHYATQLCSTGDQSSFDILNLLLRHGANVNCGDIDERTPLLWSASSGSLEALQRLIESGADKFVVDRDNLTALHCAASRGQSHIIAYLLNTSPGLNVDVFDRNRSTPLFYAVTLGHLECVKLLLDRGAQPNWQDRKSRCAAHCGAAKGQLRVLKLLHQYGASFDLENHRGDLPLHEAVQAGHRGVVVWLLDLTPSNVSACNHSGRTSLHIASATGDEPTIKILIDRGAEIDPLFRNKHNLMTPLDVAEQAGHTTAANMLKLAGAKKANELPEEVLQTATEAAQVRATQYPLTVEATVAPESSETLGPAASAGSSSGSASTPKSATQEVKNDSFPEAEKTEDTSQRSRKRSRSKKDKDRSDSSHGQITPSGSPTAKVKDDAKTTPGGSAADDKTEDVDAVGKESAYDSSNVASAPIATRPDPEEEEGLASGTDTDESVTVSVEAGPRKASSHQKPDMEPRLAKERAEGSSSPSQDSRNSGGRSKRKVKSAKGNRRRASQSLPRIRADNDLNDSQGSSTLSDLRRSNRNAAGRGPRGAKVVTVARSRKPMRTSSEENLKLTDGKLALETVDEASSLITDRSLQYNEEAMLMLAHKGLMRRRRKTPTNRYMEEKQLFQELANLKRMQIQYGNVQEDALVKRMMENFLQGQNKKSGHFQQLTFNAWEKFLYDKLKYLYIEERDELRRKRETEQASLSPSASKERTVSYKNGALFASKLRRKHPPMRDEEKVDRLIKAYGVAPLPLQFSANLHKVRPKRPSQTAST